MSTVVAQPYLTSGNGGRKLVRLSNGWEVAVAKTTDNFYFYVDRQDGNGFTQLCYFSNSYIDNNDIAISSKGTRIYAIFGSGTNVIYYSSFDVLTQQNINMYLDNRIIVDTSQTALGNVSLAINPQGTELHAVWASKNSTYSYSFNARYSKATINADGSIGAWSAVEQLTTRNSTTYPNNVINPSIVVKDGIPIVTIEMVGQRFNGTGISQGYSIAVLKKDGSLTTGNGYVKSDWSYATVYADGTYAQYSPSAVVDKDGVIHVAWHGNDASAPNYSNTRISRSIDGGVNWTAAEKITNETIKHRMYPSLTVDKNNNLIVAMHGADGNDNFSDIWIKKYVGSSWGAEVKVAEGKTGHLYHPSTLYDPTFAGTFGDIAPMIYEDRLAGTVEYIGTYTTNNAPTLTLNTANNRTLYENDTFTIDGQATDANNGNIVNVKYQIDSGTVRAIATGISDGTTAISYYKQLTFKAGKLYDGATEITTALSEGAAHTLKVWAEDDQGGKSAEQVRSFYVVANRAPGITVDSFAKLSDLINADQITITGTTSDPEGQNVKVRYNINGGAFTEFVNGAPGAFTLNIGLDKLQTGENTIQLQAEDSYNFVTSKTFKLNKTFNSTPLLHGVARYKQTVPSGGVTGIVAWIENAIGDLAVDMQASMVLNAEQENFVAMNLTNTAPIDATIKENEFSLTTGTAKEKVAIKLNLNRVDAASTAAVKKITGTLQA